MSNGGTPPSPKSKKETLLLDKLQEVEGDESDAGLLRKSALGLALRKSRGGGAEGTGPTPSADVARFKDANVTAEMVAKADLGQLEAWAKLDSEWDDEVMPLVQQRLHTLREASSLPSGPPPEPTPVSTSGSGGVGASQRPQPVEKPPSAEKLFADSLRGHALKKPLTDMYGVNPALAEEVRDGFKSGGNPSLSEDLLVRLADAKLLWRDREKYRESVGGQNGMIYNFYLSSVSGPSVGEWHVHWESGKRAGDPGWKRGKKGVKSGGDDLGIMRKLLGSDWGEVKGDSGRRTRASE